MERETFITFYIEGDSVKIEFAIGNPSEFAALAASVLNGKLRDSATEAICGSMAEGGLVKELSILTNSLSRPILPSEFVI